MKIVIVDDDQLVALSLKTILEANEKITVVGTGNDGTEAVALYEREKPDILLMDIQMKPMSGLEAAEQILEKDREAKILFLTTFSDDEYIVKALDLGAKGYILKQDFEGLVPALQAVERGQSVFGGEIGSRIPVLIGQSRKRFISAMLTGAGTAGADGPTMAQRDDVTAALSALSAEHGAWAVRVHDVAKSRAAVIAGNTWREYA